MKNVRTRSICIGLVFISLTALVGCTGGKGSEGAIRTAPEATAPPAPLFQVKQPGHLYLVDLTESGPTAQQQALDEILRQNPTKQIEKTERFGATYYRREDSTGNGAAEFTPFQLVYLENKLR
jgi:hypothetical protein